MSKRDLADKYGKSKSTVQLLNGAIRAELPGGSELLDALELAHLACGRRDMPPNAGEAVGNVQEALRAAKAKMAAEIRQRYGLPPAD